jgi:hypothetical protein
VLRNGIRLMSERGPEETFIRHSTFWVLEAEGVDSLAVVEGFTIDGLKAAEAVVTAKNCYFTIRNCTIRGGWSGVRAHYSDLRVEQCSIQDCQNGFYLFESGGVITGNDVQLCVKGFTLVSAQPQIIRNTITRNGLGMEVLQHSDPSIGGSVTTANRIWNNAAGAIRNDSYIKQNAIRTRGPVEWRPWVDESGEHSIEQCAGKPTGR